MECLLQYLDDLDDLVGAVALCAERIRSVFLLCIWSVVLFIAAAGGVALALLKPPFALALLLLLAVLLLYGRLAGQRPQFVN